MHESGNLVFVSEVDADVCEVVEATLIWEHREQVVYNNVGKRREPRTVVEIRHAGETPVFGPCA